MAGLSQNAVTLLSTTTIALNANADTDLYTVPSDKRCILSYGVLVTGSNSGSTIISIGASGSQTDFISGYILDNLDVQYDTVILMPIPNTTPVKIKSYPSGTIIQAQITDQAGGPSNDLFLFGTLY